MHRAMRVYLICFLSLFLIISAMTGGAIADITIDNGQAGTSFTGTWAVSGGTSPYGANSLWSRNGSTYTWSMSGQPSGTYEVFMWWSSWSTRATSVPVAITHAAGTANITINQRQNGSSWYSLGTYTFNGSGSARITAATGDMLSTCADAVWFHQLDSNSVPTAIIDSVSPNPASPGQNVTFTGHGTDTDGTIAAYEWVSSIDGVLSTAATFSMSSLSVGIHTISFRVRDDDGAWSAVATRALTVGTLAQELIIDNRDPQTARTGTWSASTAPNPYGADSLWSRNGTTFTWFFVPPATGTYQVSLWWTAVSSRSTNVPVTINHAGGTSTITINQRQNGGRWNNLGVFDFVGGTSYRVSVTSRPGPSSTCADAVKFNVSLPNNPPTAIIDSISPNPAQVGASVTFTGHGTDTDGTIGAFEWTSSIAGALSSQSSFSTSSLTAGTHTISYRVRDDDGAWSSPVTRQLVVQATPPNTSPTAIIDSISPNPAEAGESVTFTGHGTDTDGTIAAYEWTSSVSGTLSSLASFSTSSLAVGTHTISFRVRDDDDAWSSTVTRSLQIGGGVNPEEVIIDNRDAQTSQSPAGSWSISSAANPWGQDSHGRMGLTQATFTWRFAAPATGYYEVFMWWTNPYNQDNEIIQNAIVPVTINHADGATNTTVNQTRGWGQWNSLKVYRFEAGVIYYITITHPASDIYAIRTSADAVRFVRTDLVAPETLFATDKVVGGAPVAVQFTDRSRGTVSSYLWNFGDGATSNARNPLHNYTNPGTYIITLTASNTEGSDSEQDTIRITNGTEHIYLCDGYAHDAEFIPDANDLLASMGAEQQGGVWVYRNPDLNMTFYIHTVRTPEAMTAALAQEGSHVIFNGHSNFGLGASFADATEVGNQVIEDIRYIDDPRFTNFSSDMVSVKVDGVQYGQAYPNWNPIFQDVTSGVMPYDFDEGAPPYNYFMTYKLQGDPTAYMVELANGDYLERFPDSNVASWYHETGRAPDPSNLSERQYFIINPEPDFNYCEFTGTWPFDKLETGAQYQGYNYQYHAAGSGSNTARWNMYVKYPGTYEVRARWQADPSNATNAVYTIEHAGAGGSTNVQVNQTVASGSSGFLLGTYSFASGSYGITLTDNANGRVVADSMRLNPTFNPTKILQAEFGVSALSGVAPLVVDFTDMSLLYAVPSATITERFWDFGDGTTSTEQLPTHTYATPGVYTVSLRITDSTGAVDTETKTGLIAVGQTAPIKAQFNANRRRGSGRTNARFTDQSSGNITGWSWNFGDGATSTEQNPVHSYTEPGVYTVRLTVSGPGGSSTEEEINYVHNFVAGLLNDNVFRYKSHFGTSSYGKTILNTARSRIPQDQIRHARMFYGSCNSCNYYVGTFHQGVMYCTTSDSDLYTAIDYLGDYLRGLTDQQIVERLDRSQNIHEVFNFNLKPPSLR